VAFAQVDTVQAIEPAYQRRLANDLSRTRLNISTNTTTLNNYLDLTGNGVIVGLNDTGVDVNHPDLAGRVLLDVPSTGVDLNGHGTHVAGTILGSGVNDGGVVAPGSVNGADFRGMAPQSRVFVQPIDIVTGPLKPDTELQAQTATNGARISNNSWGYIGAYDYTFAAASWDAGPRPSIRLSARGGTATAALGIVNALNFPRSRCRPRRVWGLRVYAPGQRQAFFARLAHLACSRPAVANMHVRPVVGGRSGL